MEWNRLDNHERPPCKSSEMGVAIGGEKVEEFCPREQSSQDVKE